MYYIRQYGRPVYYRDMIRDCAGNIRLSKRQTALLAYYADCGNGFSPALKEIEKQTGIPANKVWEVRSVLLQRQLIDIVGNALYIKWVRIRALAMMPKLTKHDAMTGVWNWHRTEPTIRQLEKMRPRDKDALPVLNTQQRELSEDEKRFYRFVYSLTEKQYFDLLEAFASGGRFSLEKDCA